MNVVLPNHYRQILLHYNGGYFHHYESARRRIKGAQSDANVMLETWYGVNLPEWESGNVEKNRERTLRWQNRVSPLFLAIASGSGYRDHCDVLVGWEGESHGKVYIWWYEDPGDDEVELWSNSLEDFFASISEYWLEQFSTEKDPLFRAIERGFTQVVESYLLEGGDPNRHSPDSNWPLLIVAIYYRRLDIISLLIGRGARLNGRDVEYEATPLHWAATSHSVDGTKMLLAAGADLNATNADGETPLIAAMKAYSYRIAQLLVDEGADLDIRTQSGETALSITREGTFYDYLRNKGATAQ